MPHYKEIECEGNGHLIYLLNENDMCQNGFSTTIYVFLAAFFCTFATVIIVFYEYNSIKKWLLVHEEKIYENRKYDAFISFSHLDESFVDDHLIPHFGNEDFRGYQYTIDYRDFLIREDVAKEIKKSIKTSRRTIIVLSANFIQTIWTRLEFRTAHLQGIKKSSAKVIFIILEDVGEELDPELKAALIKHKCIKRDDPMFWEKFKMCSPPVRDYNIQTTEL